MQLPIQITFRHMKPSEQVEANIRQKAEKLDQVHDHIMSCRVIVESDHKHHHQGNLFHIRIDVTVPGKELVVSREPQNHAHEDVYVTIRDAFDAMCRLLKNHARKQRYEVKAHDVVPHGRISQLLPDEDYGRIETPDGRDIYFHRNSVINENFDKLELGSEVRFDEEMGDDGPQASTVHVLGKHYTVG
jgi:cold shock CspA family protein/ribosome-associated translation inhibitor RaiA